MEKSKKERLMRGMQLVIKIGLMLWLVYFIYLQFTE
jgi:hypothetical protein